MGKLLLPAVFSLAASTASVRVSLTVQDPPRTVIDALPVILDDGLSVERRAGREPGPVEETLATKVRPAAYTGLAVAGMVATFPTPASIGFGIVAAVSAFQAWRGARKRKSK